MKKSGKSNIFATYAKVFRFLLSKWTREHEELEKLVLPSNESWSHKVYYSLVELQRELGTSCKDKKVTELDAYAEWEPLFATTFSGQGDYANTKRDSKINKWRLTDILRAAHVLQKQFPDPDYENEAEMRRVFTLVYDVLRFKEVLSRALADAHFMQKYKEFADRERLVWLLLYDLQERKFALGGSMAKIMAREAVLRNAGLLDIEIALRNAKTRLAASLSRLRIGGSALRLEELLPQQLRIAHNRRTVGSGWVNTMKVSNKEEFIKEMAKLGLEFNEDIIDEHHFIFDPFCPKVVNFHETVRETLAISDLDRSQCLGAAVLAQAMREWRLCGPIVVTHATAPRHVAYLVNLLIDVEDAGRVLVFGAGEKQCQYKTYLRHVGVTSEQCCVFSERYVASTSFPELERVTIVLASPPCSYSGVQDVVDLVIARDGDICLLESLASANDIKQKPGTLLANQLITMKYALSKPNVQLLIYEVHTVLHSETTEVVEHVVRHANGMAMEKFNRQQSESKKLLTKETETQTRSTEGDGNPVVVPNSDLFEITKIQDLYAERCISNLLDDGCYMAVVKRKEMMQFNSIFMIKVAESKGLFGDPEKQGRPRTERITILVRPVSQTSRKIVRRSKTRMERAMSHTHSSLTRKEKEKNICPRYSERIARENDIIIARIREAKRRDVRRWWGDSTSCLRMIRKFRALRTDPRTQKFLLPSNILQIVSAKENGKISYIIA